MNSDIVHRQLEICTKYNAAYELAPIGLKVGIAENVSDHIYPLNGLRIRPEGDTTGWYLWAGEEEPSDEPDFFKPLHVSHLETWCPEVIPYLGLPPGWRFLIAPGFEDVWFDPQLLKVDSTEDEK